MKLYLLSFLFAWHTPSPKTPNFYASYIAAKEASRTYQKDMLIFFSKESCSTCELAWSTFEKDGLATKLYISTLVDAQDFDGMVLLDKYQLSKAPSWVILSPDGQVKDKWHGEWKNSSGNRPIATKDEIKIPIQQETSNTITEPNASTTASPPSTKQNSSPVASSSSVVSSSTSKIESTDKSSTPMSTHSPENAATGFVLQAGYFGSQTNAQKLVADLSVKGFNNYVIKSTEQNGTIYFRVISKTFTTENEATKEMNSLSGSGIKATVKKG